MCTYMLAIREYIAYVLSRPGVDISSDITPKVESHYCFYSLYNLGFRFIHDFFLEIPKPVRSCYYVLDVCAEIDKRIK